MKRLFKFILYGVLIFGVLLIGFIFLSQTKAFRNWLHDKVVATINTNINGEVTSADIAGNFITNLRLKDVFVAIEKEPFVRIKSITLNYNILSLLHKKIAINKIRVDSPEVYLYQKDGRWNFQNILKPAPADTTIPTTGDKASSEWDIELPVIQIKSGEAKIEQGTAKRIGAPAIIKNIDLILGLWFEKNRVRVSLGNLSFETAEPAFRVKTVRSAVNFDTKNLSTSKLTIETESSKLNSTVSIQDFDNPVLELSASGAPLSMTEIRRFFPDLRIYGNPQFEIEATGPLQHLNIKGNLKIGTGSMNIAGFVNVRDMPFRYNLTGNLVHIDVAKITNDSIYLSDLNLKFKLDGVGVVPEQAVIAVAMDTSFVMGYNIAAADINCDIRQDTIYFNINSTIENTDADFNGKLIAKNGKFKYDLDGFIRHLNVSQFDSASGINSDLNFSLTLNGSEFDMAGMAADFSLKFLPSTIQGIPIDSAIVDFSYKNETGQIQKLQISSALGDFHAAGAVSVKYKNNLNVDAKFTDFSVLAGLTGLDSLTGTGGFSGKITGLMDSLALTSQFNLADVQTGDIKIGLLKGRGAGVVTGKNTYFDLSTEASALSASGFAIDTTIFRVGYTDSVSIFDLQMKNQKTFTFTTRGKFKQGIARTIIQIDTLGIDALQQQWQKIGDSSVVQFQDSEIKISKLVLQNNEQTVSVSGIIDLENNNDFQVALNNIDLSKYRDLIGNEINFAAKSNFNLKLQGTLATPRISGQVELTGGKYSEVTFEKFKADYAYEHSFFAWDCYLAKDQKDSLLQAGAKLPVSLSLSPFEHKFYPDKPMEFKISTRGLDISFLQGFLRDIKKLRGKLVADIVLRNTFDDLRGVGPIRLINGSFEIPSLGVKYDDINIVLALNQKEVLLRDFSLRSGDGYMRAIEGGLSLSEDKVQGFSTKFKLKNFQLINNKKMQARTEGTIELSGSIQKPKFSGDLTLDRTNIFYQSFEEETAVILTAKPFFVISTDSAVFDTAGALRFQKNKDIEEMDFLETEFYKNLNGEFSLYFPRNAWIKSSDASIEIEGDVVFVKEKGPDFVLFGSFSTKRGFYELFGNRFQIEKGEIVYNGDLELNPEVAIEASTFVTETAPDGRPEKHEFKVDISGTLNYPEFRFILDGKPAEQEDVVSILLFGQRFQDLRPGQKGSLEEKKGLDDRAKGILTGQLIKQLSGRLGKKLSLDVIQIESGGDLADSKVKVGKYVTPDVFVSVSQDFGVEGNQIVEFEYEIPKKMFKFINLLLQASSDRKGDTGLDVIWKLEW